MHNKQLVMPFARTNIQYHTNLVLDHEQSGCGTMFPSNVIKLSQDVKSRVAVIRQTE